MRLTIPPICSSPANPPLPWMRTCCVHWASAIPQAPSLLEQHALPANTVYCPIQFPQLVGVRLPSMLSSVSAWIPFAVWCATGFASISMHRVQSSRADGANFRNSVGRFKFRRGRSRPGPACFSRILCPLVCPPPSPLWDPMAGLPLRTPIFFCSGRRPRTTKRQPETATNH